MWGVALPCFPFRPVVHCQELDKTGHESVPPRRSIRAEIGVGEHDPGPLSNMIMSILSLPRKVSMTTRKESTYGLCDVNTKQDRSRRFGWFAARLAADVAIVVIKPSFLRKW